MVFKHPEILYGLFALVLPVLVHLFQFRKFKPEAFTNVKYLKRAVLETRKSARLKQWLVLLTRLGVLSGLIIAFAQPYFPPVSGTLEEETVIYFDNSLSMQAIGQKGILFRQSIQELRENLPEDGTLSFFTNADEFKEISSKALRKQLQDVGYSPAQLDWKTVFLKAENLFSDRSDVQRNFVILSDFQKRESQWDSLSIPQTTSYLIPFRPVTSSNIYLDSAYVDISGADELTLTAVVKYGNNAPQEEIMISVHNGENLLSRSTVIVGENGEQSVSFNLPMQAIEQGRIEIEDNQGLEFDNTLFFSINEPTPIEVVVISDQESGYFSRIFSTPEFRLTYFPPTEVDYRELSNAQLIVLNELGSISELLRDELVRLNEENVTFAIIPSPGADIGSYNLLLGSFGLPTISGEVQQEKLVTDIHMAHPLFRSVFDKEVRNFQYPRVDSYFQLSGTGRKVLSFDVETPFLLEHNKVYLFTAPINRRHSNFQDSPIIVPTFYNMGYQTLSAPQLYYTLGINDEGVSLQTELESDHILKMASSSYTFIPRQQGYQNSVKLFFEDAELLPGDYSVLKDSVKIAALSFNYDRAESELNYETPPENDSVLVQPGTEVVFQKLHSSIEAAALWKWFVIFALVSLCIEILILKLFK